MFDVTDFQIVITRGSVNQGLINDYRDLCAKLFAKVGIPPKQVSILPKKHHGRPEYQGLAGVRITSTDESKIHLIVQPGGNDTRRELRIVPLDGIDPRDYKERIHAALNYTGRTIEQAAREMLNHEHALPMIELIFEHVREVPIVKTRNSSRIELRTPSFEGVLSEDEIEVLRELLSDCKAIRLIRCKKKDEFCWEIDMDLMTELHKQLVELHQQIQAEQAEAPVPDNTPEEECAETEDNYGIVLMTENTELDQDEPSPEESEMEKGELKRLDESLKKIAQNKSTLLKIDEEIEVLVAQISEMRTARSEQERQLKALQEEAREIVAKIERQINAPEV